MFIKGGINLSKSKIFLIACLVFVVGISIASFLPVKFFEYIIWWFAVAVFFLVLAVWRCASWVWLIWAAVFCFAVWRYGISLPTDTPDKIWHYNGQVITAQGYVAREPDVREKNQKLEIETLKIKQLAGRKIAGKILITTDLYPEYQYGDILEFSCAPENPEEIKGFAYDRYLARYQIYSVCYYPLIRQLNVSAGNWLYKKIFEFKGKLVNLIDAGLSEPYASLARPIVFGGQKGLEEKIREDFQKTGLTHIMAVSGFNVSILAAMVMAALLAVGISRPQAFYLASAVLAVYVVLVGLPASAMRAGLMGFLVLWALKLGRLNKMTNSLALTAAALLMANPRLLRDDTGFQLSFLAIAGLIYVYPILEMVWQKANWPKFKGLSDALLITLAAQVFALPVLAYNFSQISLIAPLANLAVLWAVPTLTIFILAALPLAWLFGGLSVVFFLPSLLLTKYILVAVKYLARLPFSYLEVGKLGFGWLAFYYVFVVAVLIKLNKTLLTQIKNGKILT